VALVVQRELSGHGAEFVPIPGLVLVGSTDHGRKVRQAGLGEDVLVIEDESRIDVVRQAVKGGAEGLQDSGQVVVDVVPSPYDCDVRSRKSPWKLFMPLMSTGR